jgi:uncharacterized protein (TIGR02246 family)
MNTDEAAVASILKDYQTALNGSDTEAVLRLYAPDGVFMPQHSPASVGTAALRQAYDAVFAAIKLTVKFEIAEIRQIAPDWVLARTNSAGPPRSMQPAPKAQRRTRSFFCSRSSVGPGRWHATAFAQPTRRARDA